MRFQNYGLGLAAALAIAFPGLGVREATAQPKEVKFALVAPLSGPWARSGQQMRQGSELAVEDINKAGGIKALGGAKVRLVVMDAGDSPDKARNAAQRLLADEPEVSGGTGAWLSSFTLAVTEVTERAGLPWLTISFSDQITARGFKNVFQMSPTGGKQAEILLPVIVDLAKRIGGKAPSTVGVITDNTASPLSFLKPMREGGFQKAGLRSVVDETFTPPLSDATPIVQKVRASRPDFILQFPTGIPDNKLIIEKMAEFGMGRGRIPTIGSGGHFAAPEMLNVLGAEQIEGLMTVAVGFATKEHEDLLKRFRAKYNEPWMTHDSLWAYGDMWLLKEAVEAAKSAERAKVADALRTMDSTTGAARYYSGGRIRFDDKGRRIDATLVILQWQKGVPHLIYPPELATVQAIWPRK